MAAGNHSLGTIRGTIEIDYDGAGIVKAVRDTDKAKGAMGKLDDVSGKILSGFGKAASGALKFAGGVTAASNAVGVLAGALAIVGPLAAAGFAAAPGVILAYVSAMTIAKVATAGVGDAMKAAAEGGKKFDEAMKKLSPQAQTFVKAYKAAIPVLDAVKHSIQDAFFKGSEGLVERVVNRVSQLQVVASGVARAMGQLVQKVVLFATTSRSVNSLKSVLGGVRDFIYQLVPVVGPLVQAFLKLGGQAGAFGEVLGGKVAGAIVTFTEFLNRVDLAALFEKALPILQSLGEFLKNVAIIAGQLFSIFATDGANAAGILGELAGKLAEFLQSAQGQAALQALGQALQAISGAAGQIFLALLQALAPAIVALAPGVAQLAGQIAGVLVPAINALNPLLTQLATFLSQNMSWLGPVAGAVLAGAAAYKAYTAAATAVSAVQSVLNSKMAVNTAAWIRNTAATVANKAAQLAIAATAGTRVVAAWVANTAAVVANRIAQLASAAVTGGAAAAAWIANTAAVVANKVAVLAGIVAMGAVKAATIAWTAVQWALNVALNANPIGLIVLAIAALVAAVIYAWKNSETFRNIVMAVWNAIKAAGLALWNALKAAFQGISQAFSAALNWIKSVASSVWAGIVAVVKFYINTYRTIIMAVINFVKGAWSNFLNGLRAVARAVWSAIVSVITGYINRVKAVITGIKALIANVKNTFARIKEAAVSQLNNLITFVRQLPGKVTSALGNIGRLLFEKGKSLIQGFINGIGSMIGAVKDKVKSVVGAVTRFLPGSPAKEGPLSGQGYVLLRGQRFMADFARGIAQGSQAPSGALLGAIRGIGRTVDPRVSIMPVRSPGFSIPTPVTGGGAPATRTYPISIGQEHFVSMVVDAITGEPIAVSKAADEGSRRSSWAGSGRR